MVTIFNNTGDLGRWQHRRPLNSPCPADHLDSTHICLNNLENCQKTSRMDTLEPSVDKRPTGEGRKMGRGGVRYTDWWEGAGPVEGQPARQGRAPKSGFQKWRGQKERVLTASRT